MDLFDQMQERVARSYRLSNLKTPDPGQTMAQKLGLVGQQPKPQQQFNPPKSAAEMLNLMRQGINPGTVFVGLGKETRIDAVAGEAQTLRNQFGPPPDGALAAKAAFSHARVSRGDPAKDKEDFSKVLAETK